MRRALAIDETSFGRHHPNVAIRLNNLAQLLQATNRLAEAEPLMRRALTIDEKSLGPEHPNVARDLNNLALLLAATYRLSEAEPLMRRQVAIFVEFTRRTGHRHPRLEAAFDNYAVLLGELGKSQTVPSRPRAPICCGHCLRSSLILELLCSSALPLGGTLIKAAAEPANFGERPVWAADPRWPSFKRMTD